MTKSKITIETTEDEFYEFMKFREAVNRTAVLISTETQYNGCGIRVTEEIKILTKPEAFQEINKAIKDLEIKLMASQTKLLEAQEKNKYLESAIKNMKKKKFNWFGLFKRK